MKLLIDKYSKIVEDILIDFLNHTALRNGVSVKCADVENSIRMLNENDKSIIRWGDGEAFLVLKRDVYWHEYTPELRKRLIEIIRNYTPDSPYYLCLPDEFVSCDIESLKAKRRGPFDFYQMHKGTRYVFARYFPKKCEYLSHFIFKGDRQAHFDSLVELISKFKAYVVVKENLELVDNFFKTFIGDVDYKFIQIPEKSAFREYDRILEETKKAIDTLDYETEEILILVSAGACAKVLTYDLSQEGFVTYDVGKLFECWTDNADSRVLE